MKFEDAVKEMRQGNKIIRPEFPDKVGLCIRDGTIRWTHISNLNSYHPSLEDIEATDWEVVEVIPLSQKMELKTLNDFEFDETGYFVNDGLSDKDRLREEAIKWFKATQKGSSVSIDIIPKDMRGEIAKDLWNDSSFTLGAEYGGMAMLMKIFNLTIGDLT